jgi:AcrR family transcriptional regulator
MARERKERETEWVRSQIIESAASVFTQKGFHGATMDEIARSAGYSPAAIYRYYKNKDEVFRATLNAVGERFLATIDEEPPMPLPFVDRLRWLMARQRQLAEERRDFFSTFMAQTMVCDLAECAEGESGPLQLHAQHLERLATLMQRGIAEGALRPGDPLDYATAFAALGRGFFLRWLSMPGGGLESYGERILDLFLRGAGAAGTRSGHA